MAEVLTMPLQRAERAEPDAARADVDIATRLGTRDTKPSQQCGSGRARDGIRESAGCEELWGRRDLHVHGQILLDDEPLLIALGARERLFACEVTTQVMLFRLVLGRELFVAILAFDGLRGCGFGRLGLRLPWPVRGHVKDEVHLALEDLNDGHRAADVRQACHAGGEHGVSQPLHGSVRRRSGGGQRD